MTIAARTSEEKSFILRALGETFEAVIDVPSFFFCNRPVNQGQAAAIAITPPEPSHEKLSWTESTIENLFDLPWGKDEWQKGAQATRKEAVSQLLVALCVTMQPDSPTPHIGPMWDGGVCAEWHQNGIDLELYVAPDGKVTWSFADMKTGEEQEEESGQKVWLLPESKFGEYVHRLGSTAVETIG